MSELLIWVLLILSRVGGWLGEWLDYAKLKLTSAPNLSWVGTGDELCNITKVLLQGENLIERRNTALYSILIPVSCLLIPN